MSRMCLIVAHNPVKCLIFVASQALTALRILNAKFDRFVEIVQFISGLMESMVKVVACDLPDANQLAIHIMAAMAEHEARVSYQ